MTQAGYTGERYLYVQLALRVGYPVGFDGVMFKFHFYGASKIEAGFYQIIDKAKLISQTS